MQGRRRCPVRLAAPAEVVVLVAYSQQAKEHQWAQVLVVADCSVLQAAQCQNYPTLVNRVVLANRDNDFLVRKSLLLLDSVCFTRNRLHRQIGVICKVYYIRGDTLGASGFLCFLWFLARIVDWLYNRLVHSWVWVEGNLWIGLRCWLGCG